MGLMAWLGFTEPIAETAPEPVAESVGPARIGYEPGAGNQSRGVTTLSASTARAALMEELHAVYLACPWVSTSVDTIARMVTAGGLEVVPDEEGTPMPPDVAEVERLLRYTNEREDAVQLMRSGVVDAQVFGDSFTEVGYLGRVPAALWTLDATTTTIDANDHGQVTGYTQKIEGGKTANFSPDEVIHVSLDSARGGLYGTSPTAKLLVPITAWLFAAATLKEHYRKGAPKDIAVDLGRGTNDTDFQKWLAQYQQQNLGPRAQGQPIITRTLAGSGTPPIMELSQKRIADTLETMDRLRDIIVSGYGLTPQAVGIIESGNLGGGSGEAQANVTKYQTIQPLRDLFAEKFTFRLLTSRGIDGWSIRFKDVDYRDSKTIEDIRRLRFEAGAITINRWRADLGEAPVEGGDQAIVILPRLGAVPWEQVGVAADAGIDALEPGAAQPPKESLAETWADNYARQRRALLGAIPKP